MKQSSPTHPLWGVEQVFASPSLKKKIFVKRRVKFQGIASSGAWVKHHQGYLLHLTVKGETTAFYAVGLKKRVLLKIQQAIQRSIQRTTAGHPVHFYPFLMSCAWASDATGVQTIPTQPQTTPLAHGAGPSDQHIGKAMMTCLGDALQNTGQALLGVSDTAQRMARQLREDPMGAARAAAHYTANSARSAASGIYSAGESAVSYASQVAKGDRDPFADVSDAFDRTQQALNILGDMIEKSIRGMEKLSASIRNKILCFAGQEILSEVGLSAIKRLGVAGIAAAGPKVLNFIKQLSHHVNELMPTLILVSESTGLSEKDRLRITGDLLERNTTPEDIRINIQNTGQQPRDLTSAPERKTPQMASRIVPPIGDREAAVYGYFFSDHGERMASSAKRTDAIRDFKNPKSPRPSTRSYNLSSAEMDKEIPRELRTKLNLYAPDVDTAKISNRDLVTSQLQAGDTVSGRAADGSMASYRLKSFLGAGNTTHIFDVGNGKVVRLPFRSATTQKHPTFSFNKKFVEERQKYENIPGLTVPRIHDRGKNYEYVVVDRIPAHTTGDALIQQFSDLAQLPQRSASQSAEMKRIESMLGKMETIAKQIATRSGDSTRVRSIMKKDNAEAIIAEMRQIGVDKKGQFYLMDWE